MTVSVGNRAAARAMFIAYHTRWLQNSILLNYQFNILDQTFAYFLF